MEENNVWEIIDRPERNSDGTKLNLIDSKWVFKTKADECSRVKHKARLVIRGFKDKNNYELSETYAPISRLATIRTVLAVINKLDLEAVQLDVKTAFLNGQLQDEVYMEIPVDLKIDIEPGKRKVCRLLKTIYGLKTSPKIWNQKFTQEVNKLGLERDINEPCLFTWRKDGKVVILVLYVDDIILASNHIEKMNEVKTSLRNTFEMKVLGEPNKYLGMEIVRNRRERIMTLTQVEYTKKVLERFKMSESKAQTTPMVTRQVKTRNTKQKQIKDEPKPSNAPYREAIGSLMYLATVTRPDIAFAVNYLSSKTANPSEEDWSDVKRVLRYLQGTIDTGLSLRAYTDELSSFTDSSFRDNSDSISTSGYVIKLFGDTIAWRSHKQSYLSLSTCQAEYLAMSESAQELISLDKAIRDMLGKTKLPARIWCDNKSALDCTQMDGSHKVKNFDDPLSSINEYLEEREGTGVKKHMADTHADYIKECAMEGRLILGWLNTKQNEADIMTKPLPTQTHEYLRDKILNEVAT
uniref:Reverse transcriptase Ty1/copia-type domain-containing protein n=1 Tax=Trichogramma kaykai TaxID=54128 RepID=A0ABD2XR42_9HYME